MPLVWKRCPKFEILELSTFHRICSCLRHATKKNTIRTISNLRVHSKFLQKYFSCGTLTLQVNIRTLDSVSELTHTILLCLLFNDLQFLVFWTDLCNVLLRIFLENTCQRIEFIKLGTILIFKFCYVLYLFCLNLSNFNTLHLKQMVWCRWGGQRVSCFLRDSSTLSQIINRVVCPNFGPNSVIYKI